MSRIGYFASPIILVGLSTAYLFYKKWSSGSKYSSNAEIESVAVSLKKRRSILLLLTAFETLGWLYQFIQFSLGSDNQDPYHSLNLAIQFITWVCELLLLSSHTRQYWDYSYVAISLILLINAGTTPQPYHPRDFQAASYEKLEIRDGIIYRNNLKLSPESTASIFSWASFQWMNALVIFGFHNTVTRDSIYALTFQHLARTAYEDFVNTSHFFARIKVLRRLYSSNKKEIWGQFIFSTLACLFGYLSPFFQQKILEYIEIDENRPSIQIAYMYVFCLFLVGIVKLLCNTIQLWMGRRWNIRTLIMLDSEIFSKTLKRKDVSGKLAKADDEKEADENDKNKDNVKEKKEDAKQEEEGSFSNVGKITNLMSVDADKLADITCYIFMVYNAPLEVFVALFYLYSLLGSAALVGASVMCVCFPITGLLTKKMSKNYTALTTARDKRNDLINELLQGIRMIKYFAWENNWKEKVLEARREEIKKLIDTIIIDVLVGVIYLTAPVLVTVSSFIWYTKVAGNDLTASVAFVSITLFEMLRAPLIFIPESVNTFTEAYVSLKRISGYLQEPEVTENYNSEPIQVPEGVSPQTVLARVGFEDSVFEWHYQKQPVSNITITTASEQEPLINSRSAASTLNSAAQPASQTFQLTVPKFNFPTGKLSLVCGSTGSGKSSFLNALLGEMDIVSGRVYLPSRTVLSTDAVSKVDPEFPQLYLDKVAYVAQQPFLQHASIRDNILFGLPYDAERYKKALQQCALIKDLTILADGDRTEIGEKGISLSGGQKQRVSLARAVYSYAKTVLLDDCLSAVDAHTSKHIYQKCFMGDLLKGRTIILVTHQVKLCLPGAKYFVKIDHGNVLGCDTIENLRNNGQLNKLLGSDFQSEEEEEEEEEIEDIVDEDDDDSASMDADLDNTAEAAKLVQEETSEKGQVKFKVYIAYLAACGGWTFWIILLCSYIFARFLTFGENWWIRIWAAAYATASPDNFSINQEPQYLIINNKAPVIQGVFDTLGAAFQKQNIFKSWVFEEKTPVDVDYYIGIYVGICFSYIVFDVIRNVIIYSGSIRGARTLFDSLLDRIIHAPLRFFDTTPVGRILNRFGKDVSTIDIQIARSASFLIECVTAVIASTIVISVITPQFLVVAIGISCLYFVIGLFYLRISRELKRLNSVSRSPIYSHFTESLVGVTTIRAYGVEEQFMRTVYDKIDSFVAPFYFLWMSNRWLYARIEFTGAFVTLFTGVFLLLNLKTIDAGMAGISLFYARNFLENIYWFIRQYTTVEMNLNSVERVQEYLELEQEPPAVINGHRPPAAWPTTASLEVKDLVIRYSAELEPVLHGISFSTGAHEKIGIVGRTGSGKSTMALSFFRFLEASSGSISIDGIDISTIGIQDLRTQMTIIPQDAVLFSGTIRSNIDPFEEHSDGAVWESLERTHLSKASDRLKAGSSSGSESDDENPKRVSSITSLNQQVSDGGNNFSQGQRQLLCLARALLKNSKLIIMDEATASVDYETDTKIQTTIREEFTNSTLLCIAHRLRTIIDYDRVLVLDQGHVVEYDTPYNLITGTQGKGVFKSMCEKSGEFEALLQMATDAHGQETEQLAADNHTQLY
ncbi:hypothetical protein HPULCUR_001837 [Helicostylum pulchrum]|uniref:P-loop containing nucleoside triphosphate hydrolase protein n=1 Tax=Helicostylum pulchrum TaxID=562976 RepID=A0ABP9XQ33_9FUNG